MRNIETIIFSVVLTAFGLIVMAMGTGSKRRHELEKQRLDVIQKALQNTTLDEATRKELLAVLVRDQGGVAKPWNEQLAKFAGVWRALWFGVSWVLFVVASGMLLAERLDIVRFVDVECVLPVAILGFAMLTMPLAWKELTARRERPFTQRS